MDLKREQKPQERVEAIDLAETTIPPVKLGRIGYALHGFRAAWREEPGFRNHVIGAAAMLATLILLKPAAIWWALALLCSALLLALELVNSAIERVIDHVDGRLHPRIKAIKDMSAAAVIAASIGVFLLGIIMIADTLA
ncbi:diacylglycerol kinase [Pelagibius litoralis]|uniref:Diacylglycerol kinase n=1 Tax=Pelagibius litoralis TaxID=374515 RepID=A0A967KG61_9PROT|nr:diacylglycerol kinase [Pelagibius litoralis]NIA71850.1 diacylglycerol kinase [Pelagibius litoralis]